MVAYSGGRTATYRSPIQHGIHITHMQGCDCVADEVTDPVNPTHVCEIEMILSTGTAREQEKNRSCLLHFKRPVQELQSWVSVG